jgi:hypothetical protein
MPLDAALDVSITRVAKTIFLSSQNVQVHSINWLKDVDEWLEEGRSLALFYS